MHLSSSKQMVVIADYLQSSLVFGSDPQDITFDTTRMCPH